MTTPPLKAPSTLARERRGGLGLRRPAPSRRRRRDRRQAQCASLARPGAACLVPTVAASAGSLPETGRVLAHCEVAGVASPCRARRSG